MSKGSRRRDPQVPESEIADRWQRTFGGRLIDAVPTPSCRTLTGHLDVHGCEPLPVGLVRAPSPVTLEPDAT